MYPIYIFHCLFFAYSSIVGLKKERRINQNIKKNIQQKSYKNELDKKGTKAFSGE